MHPPAVLQQHQRAFNPEYRMRESISPSPGAIDLGNARKRGCNPRRFEVHPIPRRAINNIPILDTIHLEINRQPIGKPGQIDFEIDNLRSLVFVYFPVSFYSFGILYSGTTSRWIYQNIIALAIKDQGSLWMNILNYDIFIAR